LWVIAFIVFTLGSISKNGLGLPGLPAIIPLASSFPHAKAYQTGFPIPHDFHEFHSYLNQSVVITDDHRTFALSVVAKLTIRSLINSNDVINE